MYKIQDILSCDSVFDSQLIVIKSSRNKINAKVNDLIENS